jgi:hypothetical protein
MRWLRALLVDVLLGAALVLPCMLEELLLCERAPDDCEPDVEPGSVRLVPVLPVPCMLFVPSMVLVLGSVLPELRVVELGLVDEPLVPVGLIGEPVGEVCVPLGAVAEPGTRWAEPGAF